MDIRNERNVAEPSTGATSSTSESLGDAQRRRTNGELDSLDRLELVGWDEV